MPTLGEFNTLIKDIVRLGNRVDNLILNSVQQAILWNERNFNFRYMKTDEVQFFNPTQGRGGYTLQWHPKSIEGIGTAASINDLTQIYWMERIQLKDADHYPTERPRAYEIRNQREVFLNTIPDVVYYGLVYYWHYSNPLPITTSNMYTSTDTTNWLINYASDLLMHQALIQLGPMLKDTEMVALATPRRDEALRTLMNTEDEFNYSDENPSMMYRGSYNG